MRCARVVLEYELPVTEAGVVQGQTVWCPACRAPIAHRVAVCGKNIALEYHCPNTGCPNHRRAGAPPIRLRVTVMERPESQRVASAPGSAG